MVFLQIGVLLTWVGCKDYDDDINGLNTRIDKLETGRIASLEQQVETVQMSLDKLSELSQTVGNLTEKFDNLTEKVSGNSEKLKELKDLEKRIDDLARTQGELQQAIDGIQIPSLVDYATKEWIEANLKNFITVKDFLSKLGELDEQIKALPDIEDFQKLVEGLQNADQVESLIEAYIDSLNMDDLFTSLKTELAESFGIARGSVEGLLCGRNPLF